MKKTLLLSLALAVCTGMSAQNLVSYQLLGERSQAQLYDQFSNLLLIHYGADFYSIQYTTTSVHGVPDTASGLVAVPNDLTRAYPRLVYQHGTSGSRFDVPSLNVIGGEGQLGLLFAGLGYVAILPDYLGLGPVSKGFHPYVHAASEAWAAIDMLRATETLCTQLGVHTNDQLFVTGYSQGGHGAMALHRAIENDPNHEFQVTAAAPMSGPYSISTIMRQLILSDDIYYYPAYIPNTALSYQTVYGNLFQNISELFKAPYDAPIAQFYSGEISLSELNETLITLLITNEGACRPHRMLQPDIVNAVTTQPDHPINLALNDNDTYDNWAPKAPMRLFYCTADDQVPFANSLLARDSLQAVGAPDLIATDVQSNANHGQCVVPAVTGTIFFFFGFQHIGQVGVNSPAGEPLWKIAPNPANSTLRVLALPADGRLEVLDLQGKVLAAAEGHAGENALPVEQLGDGMYLLKYTAGAGMESRLFAVQH